MTNLEKLQNWYIAQTDGDWEHSYGIKIESLDNPAWLLHIDLAETPYENLILDYKLYENSESDWYALQTKNKVFIGTGDPTKLDFLIQKFFEVIETKIYYSQTKIRYSQSDLNEFESLLIEKSKEQSLN